DDDVRKAPRDEQGSDGPGQRAAVDDDAVEGAGEYHLLHVRAERIEQRQRIALTEERSLYPAHDVKEMGVRVGRGLVQLREEGDAAGAFPRKAGRAAVRRVVQRAHDLLDPARRGLRNARRAVYDL